MSHFTTIKTQIRDIEALRAACAELGLDLLENADARGYYTQKQHGDYVVRLKGPYDIAANRQPDGAFALTTDWFNGHVEQEIGRDCGRLLQLYGVHKATREARRRGLSVLRQSRRDGFVTLIVTGV